MLIERLKKNWKFKYVKSGEGVKTKVFDINEDDKSWKIAEVPGDVHSDLLRLNEIKNPYFDKNIEELQWVQEKEWWYQTTFSLQEKELFEDDIYELNFKGLDTYTTIYLNGIEIAKHNTMFRPLNVDVTKFLKFHKENRLLICFSPLSEMVPKGNIDDQWGWNEIDERVFVRRTQCQYGWDHTPKLNNVGIWQDIELLKFNKAKLKDINFETIQITKDNYAVVVVSGGVDNWSNSKNTLIEMTLTNPITNEEITFQDKIKTGYFRKTIEIKNPALWFPVSHGIPNLYDLSINLLFDKKVIDEKKQKVGIRTIKLDCKPDYKEPGSNFFSFIVNNIPVFSKGSNWIPDDLLNGKTKPENYRKLLTMFVEANCNMMRVWGGGQYEPDEFYEICNELGILVWQDFMFVCGLYPNDKNFINEITKEAEFQVKRLRNHPSLALWCGSNEIDWFSDTHLKPLELTTNYTGQEIFHEILPSIVNELSSECEYWPSSPFGGNDNNGMNAGDKHNWVTWHGAKIDRKFGEVAPGYLYSSPEPEMISYHNLENDTTKFCSEYGMHAAPILETLKRNIPKDKLKYKSENLIFRDKNPILDRAEVYMMAHTGIPKNIEEYVDYSMLAQAEGLKVGAEHYRRRMPHCSGALFWQWNDNWPGITWSVLDYYTFPKAGYFYIKKAFAPVMACFIKELSLDRSVWITNDTKSSIDDILIWKHYDFNGNKINSGQISYTISANSAKQIGVLDKELFPAILTQDSYFMYESENNIFPTNRYFMTEFKDLRIPQAKLNITWDEQGNELIGKFTTENFAFFVNLFIDDENIIYSDNWFEVYPNKENTIKISHRDNKTITKDMIIVRCLNQEK